MAKYATIDEYIKALPKSLLEVATETRRVIDANLIDAESAIKWAHPTWSVGKQPVCYLKAASKHVTFGFWKGARIRDPSGRLQTSGNVMAHAKLRTRDDIDPKLFASWLKQAGSLER